MINTIINVLFIARVLNKISKVINKTLTIEHSKTDDLHHVSIFTEIDRKKIITDEACTGTSKSRIVATVKAVVEWIERQAFINGNRMGIASCQSNRSEGFAGFPIHFNKKNAVVTARNNALSEATERMMWIKWWENKNIKYDIASGDAARLKLESVSPALVKRFSENGAEQYYVIRPKISNRSANLVIIYIKLKKAGIITGAAATLQSSNSEVYLRALTECFRHLLAWNNYKNNKEGVSFDEYSNRLIYFATGTGNDLFYQRLIHNGDEEIVIPQLEFDEEIPHLYSDYVYVHRCRFFAQPEFIDDHVDVPCI